ncbi:MAG: hypothetical protein ACFFG0_22610 [Candidatus Thorarchaeota archaeon]
MEITINIKLEDSDISTILLGIMDLIRKEMSKKAPDITPDININFSAASQENDYDYTNESLNDTSDAIYYCENGESVEKIDNEHQKKNEEN